MDLPDSGENRFVRPLRLCQMSKIPLTKRPKKAVLNTINASQKKRFAHEYIFDFNERSAAERIGLPPVYGTALILESEVQRYIRAAQQHRSSMTQIYADDILRRIWTLATADAREIQEVWNCNCRYCNGLDHRYQYTDNELRDAERRHLADMLKVKDEAQRVPFDDEGGGGFDRYARPCVGPETAGRMCIEPTSDHDCPECRGRGVPQLIVHDTRDYSPQAAMLYNGVEVDPKSGKMRILMRDRNWALDKAALHVLGQPVARHAIAVLDPLKMSDEQLEAAIAGINRLLPAPELEQKTIEGQTDE